MPRVSLALVAFAFVALLGAFVLAAGPAFAAEEAPPVVAHVSFSQGDVAVVRNAGGSGAATINTPIFPTDTVTTGPSGRVEVQLDPSSIVRIAPSAQVRFTQLAPGRRALELQSGTLELRFFRDPPDGRVVTRSIAILAEQAGTYRVTVTADGRTEATVRSGRASAILPRGGELAILPGTKLVAQGPPTNPTITQSAAFAVDDFDRWSDARDRESGRALASSSTSPILSDPAFGMYGSWLDYPGYGQVWAPNVGQNWAPYTVGNWLWTAFGPTWVSSEPWGWAPYHYGRWFYDPFRGWCWYPSGLLQWSPALVVFIGLGGGTWWWGPSPFGNTGVGWVPLAPNEPYTPWWGWRARPGSPGIVTNNATNYANLNRVYHIQHPNVPGNTTVRFPQTQVVQPPTNMAMPPVHMVHPQPVMRTAPAAAPAAPVVHVAPPPPPPPRARSVSGPGPVRH